MQAQFYHCMYGDYTKVFVRDQSILMIGTEIDNMLYHTHLHHTKVIYKISRHFGIIRVIVPPVLHATYFPSINELFFQLIPLILTNDDETQELASSDTLTQSLQGYPCLQTFFLLQLKFPMKLYISATDLSFFAKNILDQTSSFALHR